MGRNNKTRRAAKAKARQRRGTPRSRGEGAFAGRSGFGGEEAAAPDPAFVAAAGWFDLGQVLRRGGDGYTAAQRLADQGARWVDAEAEGTLVSMCQALWQSGWQPAELVREVRRSGSAVAGRLVELAICVAQEQVTGPVDERWSAQVRALSQHQESTRPGWFATWCKRERLPRVEAYLAAGTAMQCMGVLPALDVLLPPPGSAASAVVAGVPVGPGATADPVLERVRKLLAKAEATDFEEEATTYTAKAQALMTRHAIDQALVSRPEAADVPRMMRLPVDAPYADAKASLLTGLGRVNRCRVVFSQALGMCTVVGHAEDLRAVEMLFTSLLVQAQHALTEAGRSSIWGRRGRQPSFRSSFLVAFATRIEERLTLANTEVLAEEAVSRASLVLRSREDAVEELVHERYGDSLVPSPVRGGWDLAGSAAGRMAADQAQVGSGELLS